MLKTRIPTAQAVMPEPVPVHASSRTIRNDFLHHPPELPLRVRRMVEWFKPGRGSALPHGDLGLSFHTDRYLRPGARLELTIPLRHGSQRFTATVVLVREQAHGFEIGVWLQCLEDCARIRVVEEICRLEARLLQRRGAAASRSGATTH